MTFLFEARSRKSEDSHLSIRMKGRCFGSSTPARDVTGAVQIGSQYGARLSLTPTNPEPAVARDRTEIGAPLPEPEFYARRSACPQ